MTRPQDFVGNLAGISEVAWTNVTNRFDQYWMPEPNSGCSIWLFSLSAQGYAKLGICRKMRRGSHLSWAIKNGPVPAGMNVLHKCDNPACVNPDHLFIGTIADNNADRDAIREALKIGLHGIVHGYNDGDDRNLARAKLTAALGLLGER